MKRGNCFKKGILFTYLLFSLFWPGSSFCQAVYRIQVSGHNQDNNLQFRHFESEKNLPANSCLSLMQDKTGFIWIGTEDGLARYDGYDVLIYRHDQEDSTSISSNTIWSIMEDREGRYWFGTETTGVSRFDPVGRVFTNFRHDPADSSSIGQGLAAKIYEDKQGVIWVATRGGGLNRFNKETGSFTRFTNDPDDPASVSTDMVVSILEDHLGNFWIGTWGGGLNLMDRERGKFRHFIHDKSNPESIAGNEIPDIYEDPAGNLWIATNRQGFDMMDRENERFIHHRNDPSDPNSLINNKVFRINGDRRENILIGTWGGGMDIYQHAQKRFIHNVPTDDPSSLSDEYVFDILTDRSGMMWVGTDNGLNCCELQPKPFMQFRVEEGKGEALVNKPVMSLYQDRNGMIWVGTVSGLFSLDKEKLQVEEINRINLDGTHPDDHSVTAITEDNHGKLWFGTSLGTLIRYDKSSGDITRYGYAGEGTSYAYGCFIADIYCDENNILWIGTDGDGLIRFDPENNSVMKLCPDPSMLNEPRVIRAIVAMPGRMLLTGTRSGLFVYDPEQEKFSIPHIGVPDSSYDLARLNVFSLTKENDHTYWIGTVNSGLYRYDPGNDSLMIINKEKGLIDNHIHCIVSDNHGDVWLGTRRGLSRIQDEAQIVRSYDQYDGLPEGEILVAIALSDGSLLLGGNVGLVNFDPEDISHNIYPPEIAFTNILVNNQPYTTLSRDFSVNSIPDGRNEILINHKYDNLTIEFAALHYTDPSRNRYSFILEGADKEWTRNTERRSVTYTNLSPGNYTFRVKASNPDGIWNEEGITMGIRIKPPWARTWMAYVMYLTLLAGTLYYIRRYELNRQKFKYALEMEKLRSESLRQLDTLKSNFYTNISHEFRTPLSLIMGPSEIIHECTKDEFIKKQSETINRNAYRLLSLINQILDLSKLEAGKLKLEAVSGNLVAFIKMNVLSFESLAIKKDITLGFKPENDQIDVYFDHEKMEKIISNLLSNAIKFTPNGGEILVRMKVTDGGDRVEVRVKDNGIGIDTAILPKLFDRFYQSETLKNNEFEGTGIGLTLTRELVEMHRGTIKVESKKGEWTEFTISLPLGRDHLTESEIVGNTPGTSNSQGTQASKKLITNEVSTGNANDEQTEDEKPIILLVEDNFDFRSYIKDVLSRDYLVKEATNGAQGVKKARNLVPDLVISDVMMPEMDGNELSNILKNDEVTSHIPVILLTARSDQESKLNGLATGADDYLTKPFDPEELKIKIRNLIETRQKLQEKFSAAYVVDPRKKAAGQGSLDTKFLERLTSIMEKYLADEQFSIEQFGREAALSRTQLHRKVKALTGMSASHYLRSYRLARAKGMIEGDEGTISEIAYSVGFSSPAYFTRCFRQEFGYPPSELHA